MPLPRAQSGTKKAKAHNRRVNGKRAVAENAIRKIKTFAWVRNPGRRIKGKFGRGPGVITGIVNLRIMTGANGAAHPPQGQEAGAQDGAQPLTMAATCGRNSLKAAAACAFADPALSAQYYQHSCMYSGAARGPPRKTKTGGGSRMTSIAIRGS